jgi:hypothetical protein
MIFKRAVAKLRAQDWMAIVIEIVIVVIGVFIGTQVSNWNNARIERAKTEQMARDLKPELRNVTDNFRMLTDYYAVTRRYGDTAFAGWRNELHVRDRDFVIAAYQASQISYTGVDNASWSQIFGIDRLRDLNNQRLRHDLSLLMTNDFTALEAALASDYRRDVRMVIPEDIQDAIRERCGDQHRTDYIGLPPTCTLDLPEGRFTAAAKALRAKPELVGELRYHLATTAGYVEAIRTLDKIAREALRQIDRA